MMRLVQYNGKGTCHFCMCSNKQVVTVEESNEVDMSKLIALYNNEKYTEAEVNEIIAKNRPKTYYRKRTKLIHYAIDYSDGSRLSERKTKNDVINIIERPKCRTQRSIQLPICDDCLRDLYQDMNNIIAMETKNKNKED